MFTNVGNKIKVWASVLFWVGIAISVIYGLTMIVVLKQLAFIGVIIMAIGALASWLSSLVLYGFGELIENSSVIAGKKNADVSKADTANEALEKRQNEGVVTEEAYQKINDMAEKDKT